MSEYRVESEQPQLCSKCGEPLWEIEEHYHESILTYCWMKNGDYGQIEEREKELCDVVHKECGKSLSKEDLKWFKRMFCR